MSLHLLQNRILRISAMCLVVVSLQTASSPPAGNRVAVLPAETLPPLYTFAITADMRSFAGEGLYDSALYYRGALQALQAVGGADFMIVPGDLDPTTGVDWTIDQTLGVDFPWYPVIGNHELPGQGSETTSGANLAWLQAYPLGSVNPGPAPCPTTTYSFDRPPAHFAVLNVYCDAAGPAVTVGDITGVLYDWLAQDLAATTQPYIFVVGHEPAFPQPDLDNGFINHLGNSLDQYPAHRDRFWSLLHERGVTAYLTGHTHTFSAVSIQGVWQIDAGHARGLGDLRAASTFLRVKIYPEWLILETYRANALQEYSWRQSILLTGPPQAYLPFIQR